MLLLLTTVSLSLFSCGGKPQPKEGIVITPEVEYNFATKSYAQDVVYKCLEYYTKKLNGGTAVSQSEKKRLTTRAARITEEIMKKPIDELVFLDVLVTVQSLAPTAIDELFAYSKTGVKKFTAARTLYFKLTDLAGADAVLDTYYRLAVYSYDYRCKDAAADFKLYGTDKCKERLERLQKEKAVLDTLGQEQFESLFLQSLVLTDFFFSETLSEDLLSSFTDSEILLFLKNLDISEATVGTAGWELALEKILPSTGADSYASKIGAALLSNGDYKNLAKVMDDVSALFASVCKSLTETEIALLRSGDRAGAMQMILRKFTEDDFARLARIAAISIDKEAYHSIALAFYGEDYAAYAASISPIGTEALRASLETTTFNESLEKFVAGVSPAFSYGMRK